MLAFMLSVESDRRSLGNAKVISDLSAAVQEVRHDGQRAPKTTTRSRQVRRNMSKSETPSRFLHKRSNVTKRNGRQVLQNPQRATLMRSTSLSLSHPPRTFGEDASLTPAPRSFCTRPFGWLKGGPSVGRSLPVEAKWSEEEKRVSGQGGGGFINARRCPRSTGCPRSPNRGRCAVGSDWLEIVVIHQPSPKWKEQRHCGTPGKLRPTTAPTQHSGCSERHARRTSADLRCPFSSHLDL